MVNKLWHLQDGNLVIYDGTREPVFYTSTFQSAVTQPGEELALVVDAMAAGFNGPGGKIYPDAEPIYRATFCVTATSASFVPTCFVTDYNGTNTQTYFRPSDDQVYPPYQPSPVGSIDDISLGVEFGVLDQVKQVRPGYASCAPSCRLEALSAFISIRTEMAGRMQGVRLYSNSAKSFLLGQVSSFPPAKCNPVDFHERGSLVQPLTVTQH